MEHLLWLSAVSFVVFLELGFDGLKSAVHVSEQFEHLGVNWRGSLLVLGLVIVAAVFCVFVSLGFFAVWRSVFPVSIFRFVVVVVVVVILVDVLDLGAGLRGVVRPRNS